ncbi:SAV_2336 N-terminal domain-related protein [Streptomyces avidinii]|uniref:SAV_2336 N-terminal domain-related protein n=1 Tax=Streptomyces avidinii TaxID=1895 RepID=UPI00378B860D
MIEKLLAALADGADGSVPYTGLAAEEIADILWLAARVDPAGARPPADPGDAGPPGEPPPLPDTPSPGAAGPLPEPGTPAGAEPVQLFPAARRDPDGKPAEDGAGRRGSPLRLPRAASLDDPLALMRALRPVGRRSIGGPGEELDEQLTVERSIERMVTTPVLRPAESRWLDLALVVDTHRSMLLWSDHVDEVRRVLTRSGVFRDVRTWQLTGTGTGATPMVTRGHGGPPRNPLELADPAGRRLILVLSDTVAGGWRQAPVQHMLRHWCAHNAVAVLNVLPERLWTRGAVRPVPFAVRAERPAAATRSWQRIPVARRAGRRRAAAAVVPVVGVASGSLARLVRVVAGDGRWRRLACLRLDAAACSGSTPADPVPGSGRSALEVVEHFRANASPTAQQLAAHLAAVPLTLPVMTLVRRSLLRGSEHGHLAEVALGGLFEEWQDEQDPSEVEFQFLPGVREALLGSQLRGDVAAVRELVRRRVWEFMSRNRRTGPDFSATRVTTGRDGSRRVAEDALPFAARPPQDPGLADRVVRVRYDALPEPQEVGTLLTPRLVLTVGDAQLPLGAVAWVRPGDREIPCRTVWSDDAAPRMLLLRADEDLVDPAVCAEPLRLLTAEGHHALDRLRIDGRTDQGDPVALTGAAAPHDGARNGELVRLSAEPESWTHFRGGPVSVNGMLAGVVHTVWPNRMVFLLADALLEQPDFRAALERSEPAADTATALSLAVLPGADGVIPIGSSPIAETRDMLAELMTRTDVAGRVTGGEADAPLLLALDAPGAHAKAGRLLSGLPGAMRAYGHRRMDGLHPSLAVAVGIGTEATSRLVRHPAVLEQLRRKASSGGLALAVSSRLHEDLAGLFGFPARLTLERVGAAGEGWACVAPEPAEPLGQVLAEADRLLDVAVDWPTCGFEASEAEPWVCIGIRLPGHERCLAHLGDEEQRDHLAALVPGAQVDFRGTTFDHGLLPRLLTALEPRGRGPVEVGPAAFDRAYFVDDWNRAGIEFSGRATFVRAVFAGRARFTGATFGGPVSLDGAVFQNAGDFEMSSFHRAATFRRTRFRGSAGFKEAVFLEGVSFGRAVLEASADLYGVQVAGAADFSEVAFGGVAGMSGAGFAGPVSFASTRWRRGLMCRGAVFEGPLDFEGAGFHGTVRFDGVRFETVPDFAIDRPGIWNVEEGPDGTWNIRLISTAAG